MKETMKVHLLKYGDQVIPVHIRHRVGNRLTLSVHPDLTVTAAVPADRRLDDIIVRLRARAPWIIRQLREMAEYRPPVPPRRYISGESHLYLGKLYRLRVRKADDERVWMEGGYIRVNTSTPKSARHVREQLQRWYRGRSEEVLTRRFNLWREKIKIAEPSGGGLLIRRMRTRWGSCTGAGRVLLNPDLVKVPIHCIDYVVLHELCHRRVLRHDRVFFAMLGKYMPDWERRRRRLNTFVLPID